jgi:hypothetical protein
MSICFVPGKLGLRAVLPSFVVAAVLSAAPAYAQGGNASHWGASVSFTPLWKAHDQLQELLWAEGEGTLEGSEFTVGLVRGSTRGGDWGVSFVRKPIKDGTTITEVTEDTTENSRSVSTYRLVFHDVYLQGVEFHGFIPFATIKDRVQIGLNLSGGIAAVRGEIEEAFEFFSEFRLPNGQVITNSDSSVTTSPAKDVIYEYQPLGKVEGQVALIVAPWLKVKAGGGFNMPSAVAFRVGATFLIGAK